MSFKGDFRISSIHLFAGALAGAAEHVGMFPVDTIKTHLQANLNNTEKTILSTAKQLYTKRGFLGLFRGLSAVALGAGPAHAIYFASYEFFKYQTGGGESHRTQFYQTTAQGLSGICSTLLSEAIHTPMDTIKQKRQLGLKNYSGTLDCIITVIRTEGSRALYASYTTSLMMTIPFSFFYFPTYEILRKFLKSAKKEHDHRYDPKIHILAGGGAGALAAGITNPLDVSKTRLQTQGDVGKTYSGVAGTLAKLWKEEGIRGYSRGIVPRMVFFSTSAGIAWATYEYVKYLFGAEKYFSQDDDVHPCCH
eukprot:TRINITY_DN6981_c0_g1_i1.p1 TRINITY_DN6981_c0_g1~~TRINITY_DN6981_c0_g1_i1.p1  ORF type:complete len:307 (-),score=45.61 TRINITY_DN6981_c0_g1_i1:95-1015(-)